MMNVHKNHNHMYHLAFSDFHVHSFWCKMSVVYVFVCLFVSVLRFWFRRAMALKRVNTTATARLKQDYMRIIKDPVPYVQAVPLPSNILEWWGCLVICQHHCCKDCFHLPWGVLHRLPWFSLGCIVLSLVCVWLCERASDCLCVCVWESMRLYMYVWEKFMEMGWGGGGMCILECLCLCEDLITFQSSY